jgi:hypothetical protein
MTTSISKKWTSPLLEELDALVDESVGSMSPKQLKEFEKTRKRIMTGVTSEVLAGGVPPETEEREKQALHA